MICKVKLSIYELNRAGKILESLYNSKFEKILYEKNYRSTDLSYKSLILERNNRILTNRHNINFINKLMMLIENIHKVYQKHLADANNPYKISINLINKKKEILITHLNNLDELLDDINSNILKRTDINYIKDIKEQIKNINYSIETLDTIKDELMRREIIELDEILDIDELC